MFRLLLIISLLLASKITATENSKKEVILLHTNDIESVYEPIPALWRDDMDYIGGLSHLATLIRNTREEEGITFRSGCSFSNRLIIGVESVVATNSFSSFSNKITGNRTGLGSSRFKLSNLPLVSPQCIL